MKKFLSDDTAVLVQVKDIIFMRNNGKLPKRINEDIIQNIDELNADDFIKLENELAVCYMRNQDYILNSNQFNDLSIDDIKKVYYDNQLRIRNMLKAKKQMLKKERDTNHIDDLLNCLKYYQSDIKNYIKSNKENKKLKYEIGEKNNGKEI